MTERSVRTGSALSGLGRLARVELLGTIVDDSLHRPGAEDRAGAPTGDPAHADGTFV